MIWNIFILVAGLALILVGANALTDGANIRPRNRSYYRGIRYVST